MITVPQRGEVWIADLGMAAKIRPVLVISVPFGAQDYALFHVVPHTTKPRDSQFEVVVALPWLDSGAFNVQGSQSIPRQRLTRRIGMLNQNQLEDVEAALSRWLGLEI